MDQAVDQRHAAGHLDALLGEEFEVAADCADPVVLDALDELHGEDSIAQELIDERGQDDVWVVREVLAKAAIVFGLDPEIELPVHGLAKPADGFDRRDQRVGRDHRHQARAEAENRLVEVRALDDPRPANFDRDDAARERRRELGFLEDRAMDLRDRRRKRPASPRTRRKSPRACARSLPRSRAGRR